MTVLCSEERPCISCFTDSGVCTGTGTPTEQENTILRSALNLACKKISDGPQEYSEAKSATDWAQHFISIS